MSAPVDPQSGSAISISVVRDLLQRDLLDRAIGLAEARWRGSGPMVELAYDWARLSPAQRRERLTAIGPEDLARLRGVAELNPDFARVLDDLEVRGVIPPAAATLEEADPAPEAQVVDAFMDVVQQRATEMAAEREPALGRMLDEARSIVSERPGADVSLNIPKLVGLDESRDLSSGGETSRFLTDEAERRAQASDAAEQALERIRQRMRAAMTRLPEPPSPLAAVGVVPAAVVGRPVVEAPEASSTPPDERIVTELATSVAWEPQPGDPTPSDATLRSVARALGLSYVRMATRDHSLRELYGGLTRRGRGVEPTAGLLPRALSGANLVVVDGRLHPTLVGRLDEGYLDIPGTRATVQLHPRSRLVVLP